MLIGRPRQRGFSIIELMVAITIVAMLLALSVPSFRSSMQSRQIRTAADAIQNGLLLARTEALRRNRTVQFQMLTGNSWQVGCNPVDATVVNGEQNCPALIQSRDQQEGSSNAQVAFTQLLASTGSAAASPVFTGTIKFTPLGRTTADTLPTGNLAQFVVTNPGAGTCAAAGGQMRCLNVVVTSAGQVRMCDPAVAQPDMRAC